MSGRNSKSSATFAHATEGSLRLKRTPAIFDQPTLGPFSTGPRGDVVSRACRRIKEPLSLRTAIDVGCGLGYFSGFLRSLGFDVTAVDGGNKT